MYKDQSFEEWFAIVKREFEKNGLALPEDIEMMELAHMECREEEKSVDQFVEEMIKEQKG